MFAGLQHASYILPFLLHFFMKQNWAITSIDSVILVHTDYLVHPDEDNIQFHNLQLKQKFRRQLAPLDLDKLRRSFSIILFFQKLTITNIS